jgi:hypothetical protein
MEHKSMLGDHRLLELINCYSRLRQTTSLVYPYSSPTRKMQLCKASSTDLEEIRLL